MSATSTQDLKMERDDLKEIVISVKLALKRRKGVMALLTSLEKAWREAAGPHIALNKPLAGSELPAKDERKEVLLLASKKKRKIEELQQKVFLNFQNLTDTAHNNQLVLGKEILNEIAQKKKKSSLKEVLSSRLIETFFKNENSLNKAFLKGMKQLERKTNLFLLDAQSIKLMKCTDPKIQKLLQKEVEVIIKFLNNMKDIFKK